MFSHLPFWPDAASTTASRVDALYIFLVLVSAIMTALIFTTLIVFAIKFRRRRGHPPEQIEGSQVLEITWSTIPFAVFLSFFV